MNTSEDRPWKGATQPDPPARLSSRKAIAARRIVLEKKEQETKDWADMRKYGKKPWRTKRR